MTTKHLPSDYYEKARVELQDWMERHGFVDAEVLTWVHPGDGQTRIEARWSQHGEQHGVSNSSPHLIYQYLDSWHVGQHPYERYLYQSTKGRSPAQPHDFEEEAKMILATHTEGEDFESHLAYALQSIAAEAKREGHEEAQHKCVVRRVGDPPVTVYLHDGTKVTTKIVPKSLAQHGYLEVREQAKVRAVGVERPEEGKVDLQGIKDAPFLGEQVIDSLEYARKAETELLRRTIAQHERMMLRLAELFSPDLAWCVTCEKWCSRALEQSCPHRKVER